MSPDAHDPFVAKGAAGVVRRRRRHRTASFSVHSEGTLPIFAAAFMAVIKPFAAWRPHPDLASRICELPYDVVSSEEARALAADNPLSFFHVSKPEIDLPPETPPDAPAVYAKARENFARLVKDGALLRDPQPAFYLYRQQMGSHVQTGLVAAASCQEYLDGVIKKHELTRPDKEDDRLRHIEALNAQTGPVFLIYRAPAQAEDLLTAATQAVPDVDFTAADGVRHTAWTIRDDQAAARIEAAFAQVPALYIADGHHRCAAAARLCQARRGRGAAARFLAVLFPHDQVQVLPYNRVLQDLNGLTPDALLKRLEAVCVLKPGGQGRPARPREVALYLAGRWYALAFRPHVAATSDAVEQLDVSLLQRHVLAPLFGIDDPRTSARLQFVGGIRGPRELEHLVDSGRFACAFSLFPTRVEDLLAVADAGGIMPPKSTWFEPKLRDGLFSHALE
jgi:uncharacterized protein (DUF1015 family)